MDGIIEEGMADGLDEVGCPVGVALEGIVLGATLGEADGSTVGHADGQTDGAALGARDG